MTEVRSEVDSQPIAVIAGQMKAISDDFVPRVFETMRAEISGLNHDARLLGLWKASLTEAVDV